MVETNDPVHWSKRPAEANVSELSILQLSIEPVSSTISECERILICDRLDHQLTMWQRNRPSLALTTFPKLVIMGYFLKIHTNFAMIKPKLHVRIMIRFGKYMEDD